MVDGEGFEPPTSLGFSQPLYRWSDPSMKPKCPAGGEAGHRLDGRRALETYRRLSSGKALVNS